MPLRCQIALLLAAPAMAQGATQPSPQESIDLRAFQSAVKDQADRGTCTAFAVAAALETFPGVPLDTSEQFLYALAKDSQTTRAQFFAGYYKDKEELKALFTDGLSLKEYEQTLPLYGACEERFFPYRKTSLVITDALASLLPKAERDPLAKMVYSRTQFAEAYRDKMRLLGKFDVSDVEVIDFIPDHIDKTRTLAERRQSLQAKSKRLTDWLRDGSLGHQAVPLSYVISRAAWFAYSDSPDVPVFTTDDFPKDADDAGGHAVTLVGWAPSLAGRVEQEHPKDPMGYYLIKNSWGPDWGGLGGYAWVQSDLHLATIKQALLIGSTHRRESSAVHSPFDRARLAKGAWRLKAQTMQAKDRKFLVVSTYASDLREPNLPGVRYILTMTAGDKQDRVVSPFIPRTKAPGFVWMVPLERGTSPRFDVTMVHHRTILTEPEPTSGVRFQPWEFTAQRQNAELDGVPGGDLSRDQARAAISGR